MNILLLAFALPVATILLAIVLQRVLKCPLLVAATFFAILLVLTYAVFDSSFLVFAILYTILAYVTAVLTRLICNLINRFHLNNGCNCICDNQDNSNCCYSSDNGLQVASGTWCCRTRNTQGASQSSNTVFLNNGTGNSCGCSNDNSSNTNDPVIVLTNTERIMNNGRSNGRNGCNCGCNRR